MSVVLKERRSKDSVTLAWQGPERPNGAIVEYEVIYYEKVKEMTTHKHTHIHTDLFFFFLRNAVSNFYYMACRCDATCKEYFVLSF